MSELHLEFMTPRNLTGNNFRRTETSSMKPVCNPSLLLGLRKGLKDLIWVSKATFCTMHLSRLPYTQNGALFSFRSRHWHLHKQGTFTDTTNRSATVAASARKTVSHSLYISTFVAKECTLINLRHMIWRQMQSLAHRKIGKDRPTVNCDAVLNQVHTLFPKDCKAPPPKKTQITIFAFSNTDKNMKWLPTARKGWKVQSESCQSQKHGF